MSNSRAADLDSMSPPLLHLLPSGVGVEPASADALAVATDANGVVTWCSDAVGALLGLPGHALVGRPFPLDVFDPEELERRAAAAGRPVGHDLFLLDPRSFERRRGPGPRLGELDRRRPGGSGRTSSAGRRSAAGETCRWNVTGADGDQRVLSLTITDIRDSRAELRGYYAQATDVTEEHRTSSLLAQALLREQEATRRLAELDRLRTDFVATVSHELRTPLTSILGFVELLEDGLDHPERRRIATSAIRRNVGRLQDLAEGLVILSDAPATDVATLPPLDLREVVAAVGARQHDIGETQGIVLELELPERPVMVVGDVSRLGVVVLNLLENAVKFTPPGGRVVCRVETSSGEATIEVSDTGWGVPGGELTHLFSPFFRGAAARDRGLPGSGLGLAIVAAVVEQHGGRLHVSTERRRGSVFTVHLPSAQRRTP